eukprot:SAG11_NODE_119_length_15911_cov_7.077599_13_plen_60_part_00
MPFDDGAHAGVGRLASVQSTSLLDCQAAANPEPEPVPESGPERYIEPEAVGEGEVPKAR